MSNLPPEQMKAINLKGVKPADPNQPQSWYASQEEVVRLYAIERRLKLLFKGSDEWVAEVLNPGPGWETDKALACVRELRQLCDGMTAEEVTWQPVK